jgi:hypothetical protein
MRTAEYRQLLEPIGNVPPAEIEAHHRAAAGHHRDGSEIHAP